MKAVLLSAGLGTRLLPFTKTLPKCLMPINGRPLMEYWLQSLINAGVFPILINLHHHKDVVLKWLEEQTKFKDFIQTSFEPELLGTAGTVLNNKEFIADETFMLIHGDNLCFADISKFAAAHQSRPKNTAITMMTFKTSVPEQCGIVECDNSGVVQKFYEKLKNPPVKEVGYSEVDGNALYLANGAVYVVEPEIVKFLADFKTSFVNPFIDFSTDVLPNYAGRIYTWHNEVYHRDIGTPESLMAAQKEVLKCRQYLI